MTLLTLLFSPKFEHRPAMRSTRGLSTHRSSTVPYEIGSTRVIKPIYRFSTCACLRPKLSSEMNGRRYIERVIKSCAALLPMRRSSFGKRARYPVLDAKAKVPH